MAALYKNKLQKKVPLFPPLASTTVFSSFSVSGFGWTGATGVSTTTAQTWTICWIYLHYNINFKIVHLSEPDGSKQSPLSTELQILPIQMATIILAYFLSTTI